jgi:hypothetical protein
VHTYELILRINIKKNTIFVKKESFMATIENIKNRLIDRILLTRNKELLNAIDTIFNSTKTEEKFVLNSYQLEMLWMSEKDIKQGNLISETELKEADKKWMS